MDEFRFPANPSASDKRVSIICHVRDPDAAIKSQDLGGHSQRKPGFAGALDAFLLRILKPLERSRMDRQRD